MKKIGIRATNSEDEIGGLYFFVQCVDELLFDHSDDSYKAPALNVVSRALELKRVAEHVKDKGLPAETLRTFISELQWGINSDPILEHNEKEHLLSSLIRVSTGSFSTGKLLPVIELIIDQLFNYGNRIKIKIKETIIDGRQKRNLRALATAFCANVEIEGHSRRYAYQHLQRTIIRFLKKPILLDIPRQVDRFLDGFNGETHDAIAIFRCGQEFEKFTELALSWGITISTTPPKLSKETKAFSSFVENRDGLFLTVREIKAEDPYRARDNAEYLVNMFSGVIRYFCHDKQLHFGEECIVEMNTDGRVWHASIGSKVNPMLCRNESDGLVDESGFKKLSELISGQHLNSISTKKFVNALTYHRAALRAPVYETQLVALWSALEGLLPSPETGEVRIKHFAQVVSNILTLAYSKKLFNVLADQLGREFEVKNHIEANVEGDSWNIRIINLICCSEYEQARLDIAAMLDENPLLRFRMMELNESFSSAKSTYKALLHHRDKVEWHIHRIYWSRNLIVHSADTMPYMMTIVENLHDYLDLVIDAIATYAVNANKTVSIDAVIQSLNTDYELRINELSSLTKKADTPCNNSNVISIVHGRHNPFILQH